MCLDGVFRPRICKDNFEIYLFPFQKVSKKQLGSSKEPPRGHLGAPRSPKRNPRALQRGGRNPNAPATQRARAVGKVREGVNHFPWALLWHLRGISWHDFSLFLGFFLGLSSLSYSGFSSRVFSFFSDGLALAEQVAEMTCDST